MNKKSVCLWCESNEIVIWEQSDVDVESFDNVLIHVKWLLVVCRLLQSVKHTNQYKNTIV